MPPGSATCTSALHVPSEPCVQGAVQVFPATEIVTASMRGAPRLRDSSFVTCTVNGSADVPAASGLVTCTPTPRWE